ncbi:MAG: hypothetical protein JWQ09_4918 [Segetibacter sp.]|nr:hypothetical protein [Segetibacter sp.]
MSTFDISLSAFQQYKSSLQEILLEELSEADTRSKIIDYFFINILGWKENHIKREGHVDSGYYDYIITLNGFQFVVEAKKSFKDFKLPIKGRRHKIKSIFKENQEVIKQLRGYLIDIGLTHGIITNGRQFIVGRFVNIDGTNWLDNDVLLFQSIEKIEENFIDFYNMLSYDAIEQNGRIKIQAPPKFKKVIVDSVPNKKQELIRNDFSSKLLPIIDKIFNEIGDTDDLELDKAILESCYVPTVDIYKYSDDLKGLFLDLPPTFDSKISKIKNTEKISSEIKLNLKSDFKSSPSPIILIGGKGAGKTTFIRYFFKVVLSNKESKEIPSVYLDFRNYTQQQIEDTKTIYSTILYKLISEHEYLNLGDYKILKAIFKSELELKTKGVWSTIRDSEKLEEKTSSYLEELTSDPVIYLTGISKYLIKFQRRNLCVIFDNADQLDNDSQKAIFLLAQSLRGSISAIVFVSLREGYFFQWKDKPPFDAFHSNVYHISAPPYSEVLKKRIQYIINKIAFDPINTFINDKRIEFEDKTLKNLFQNLHLTLFSTANSSIMKYLEQTSYPNIRKGLKEMNNFLVSGHTKIDDYITSRPNIPIWEFIKSIGLNNKLYYIKENSVIYNIFNPTHELGDHFLKIRVLKYLYEYAKNKGFKEEFLSVNEIVEVFLQASYGKDCIVVELDSLLKNSLLTSDKYTSDIETPEKISMDIAVKISNTGIYYLNDLINSFHYLDLVLQDTPIFVKSHYDLLIDTFAKSDNYGNRNIVKRLKSVDAFINYIEDQERKMNIHNENTAELDILDFNIGKYLKNQFIDIDKPRIEKALYN